MKADILHIDATGGICRRSVETKGEIYLFSIVPDSGTQKMECVSVSDYLTEGCGYADLTYWLSKFCVGTAKVSNCRVTEPKKRIVVTDLSWAIIHAALLVFGVTEIERYLRVVFDSMQRNACSTLPFRLVLCSSHLISRVSKTIPKFKSPDGKRLFLTSFGRILTASTLEEACQAWKEMVIIFNSEFVTQTVTHLIQDLQRDAAMPVIGDDENLPIPDYEKMETTHGIRNKSPFKQLFTRVMEAAMKTAEKGCMNNLFFNPDAVQYILTHWCPLYGLWGSPVLQGSGRHYLTNAKIESWFA